MKKTQDANADSLHLETNSILHACSLFTDRNEGNRGGTVLARLVSRDELDSAIKTAVALRKYGVNLFVFCDQSLMHRWVDAMVKIPSITVKIVSEVPHD
jgi:hypothetical protein